MGDYNDAFMRNQNAAVQARTKAQNRANVLQLKLVGGMVSIIIIIPLQAFDCSFSVCLKLARVSRSHLAVANCKKYRFVFLCREIMRL